MKRYLMVKLITVNLIVVGFAVVVVWLAIDTLAAGYFVTLMEKYHISPEPAHAMFLDSIHRYLIWAFAGAISLAVGLSYVMNRRILGPLTRMNAVTGEIAGGEFSARVPITTADEVGQLARAFNHMAEKLEKIERLRRTLMIDVAHELRTPLTNIRGYLEALNDGVLPPAPETLALLQDETLRLVQLVEDVLALARADAAGGRLRPRNVDLNRMVRNTLEAFSPAIQKKSLTIDIDAARAPTTIHADPDRLSRVLRNLTDNAVQYAPPATAIKIHIASDGRDVTVAYINDATELLPDDLPYLFERFYRGEKSRSRHHGGAGIGLAIVKELVDAHGGNVHAELDNGRVHIGFSLPRGQNQEEPLSGR
ncbi:ATP-binding protein [uncultured Desulfosarcina sp.]|uniref:sensor histidine kinase n=1 Tax=uncultured Desulfosarcina sp. TaxID=218289 RepID=UPI0029C7DEDE|nr:ATP-binding protein [uncultured Desulfosarcina sp.]